MKAIYDAKSANLAHAEEQQTRQWEQAEKNRSLKMTNPKKKQIAWRNLFPKPTYSPEIESMVW